MTLLFSALSAGGFAIFFQGSMLEAGCAFFIGLIIKAITWFMEQRDLNNFFINAIGAAFAAMVALGLHKLLANTDVDIMIISSIMLLLAITNAIRDTVAGDYLSGVARACEAFLVAIAIAVGIGFILSIFMVQGGV